MLAIQEGLKVSRVLACMMLPPPTGSFQSREELLKHVRDFAMTQGYMVSIKDSKKEKYVHLGCDRGGVYRKKPKVSESICQRNKSSRLINCPFELAGKKEDNFWILIIKNGEHNHEASQDISGHPSCRRFTEEEALQIKEMTAAGVRPRHILSALRQSNPELLSMSRNVYNIKAKMRRKNLSEGQNMAASEAVNGVSQAYLGSKPVEETRALVAELCRHFYSLGWVSGTGGSITIKAHDDSIPKSQQLIVMSPSGVQKERMVPEDMYVLSSSGSIFSSPNPKPYPHKPPKCTDCAPIFMKAYEMRNAGAVIHSHGMESCLVTMIHPFSKEFRITHMEMIKGIQGHGYHDELVVPIIENTAHEGELTESFKEAIEAYPKATAVLVRNHGIYVWGDSWISAKTQAECYHYLFDAAIKLHQLGLDWSTPSHNPVHRVWGGDTNINRVPKAGILNLNNAFESPRRFILLDIEGTTTPISFVTDVLFPYACDNVGKHLTATYETRETQDDIKLLRAQVEEDIEKGVVGALPIPTDNAGKEEVIGSLVANVEAMIKADRKITALKQLQGHIWRTGFQNNELEGFVFEDVPDALEKWHASGIKVYIYSSGSREAQRLLFSNSNYGDLRKYLCGFFDTTIGSKRERQSYFEISQSVGVDKLSEILFVTDVLQEAVAAKAAGLEVIISIRPGNGPLPENHGFKTVGSFSEI